MIHMIRLYLLIRLRIQQHARHLMRRIAIFRILVLHIGEYLIQVSGMQRMVDKRGNTTISFNVMGIGINAQIEIYMSPGTNRASATIYPNFNSNTIWVEGEIVPYENSDVFEGMSL